MNFNNGQHYFQNVFPSDEKLKWIVDNHAHENSQFTWKNDKGDTWNNETNSVNKIAIAVPPSSHTMDYTYYIIAAALLYLYTKRQ